MRRKRPLLQVSTFPFLAVLLCAMGALILFLLVMDRRAKIVARNKALKAQEVAQEHERNQEAELASRRQEQHEHLLRQKAEVVQARQHLDHQVAQTQEQVRENELKLTSLRHRLADEFAANKQATSALNEQRLALKQSKNDSAVSQAKLLQLTAELEQLEKTLTELKAANRRPDEIVALVPYRGSQADNRRPIYVECRGDGFVLHPDRLILSSLFATSLDLRREIEKRLKLSTSGYVLFLVRPDGIPLYYRALGAIEGLKLDFGYEFVDADWVLELPVADQMTSVPAPLPTERPAAVSRPAARPESPRGPIPSFSREPTASPGAPGLAAGSRLNKSPLDFRPVKPVPTAARLLSTRDLTLVVDCTRDGVVLEATKVLYPLNSLKQDASGEHRLVQEIKALVARRQAGESPYQPAIRFRIHPDGLRAYYFVYPLLESLRLPMTRENLQ